jgi:hypothetical protein
MATICKYISKMPGLRIIKRIRMEQDSVFADPA